MNNERNHLNPHNIDPSRIDPAHLLPDAGKMDRVDRAPGFDSVREGKPREMAYDQAVRVIKAMGKYIVDNKEPRPSALEIVDAVALAVKAVERLEEIYG